MPEPTLRTMEPKDWTEVAGLISVSTNYWYEAHGMGPIFPDGAATTRLFCDVYEALDPGCCVLAEDPDTESLMGSCFYHPRETHLSLGIMNVHPNYYRRGVARRLLNDIIARAEQEKKPVRLISSGMNLDSFSLYTRAGFVPRQPFQDMILTVPKEGLPMTLPDLQNVRVATPDDALALTTLEEEVAHIRREQDYHYFLANAQGIWHTVVSDREDGKIQGFLVSVSAPGLHVIGPGVAKSAAVAAALLLKQLNHHRGQTPLFLVPMDCPELVKTCYAWGARNCECHFAQVRGEFLPFAGVVMPTFLPESA